jgi:predicted lipase
VYGLWALYDVIDGLRWSELTPLARDVESCLARVVPRFTMANGWSLYALDTYGHAPVASVHYHRSHIRMFTVLHARTGLAAFADAVERWHGALNSRSARCTVLARKCAQVIWMRDVRRLPLVDSIWA